MTVLRSLYQTSAFSLGYDTTSGVLFRIWLVKMIKLILIQAGECNIWNTGVYTLIIIIDLPWGWCLKNIDKLKEDSSGCSELLTRGFTQIHWSFFMQVMLHIRVLVDWLVDDTELYEWWRWLTLYMGCGLCTNDYDYGIGGHSYSQKVLNNFWSRPCMGVLFLVDIGL